MIVLMWVCTCVKVTFEILNNMLLFYLIICVWSLFILLLILCKNISEFPKMINSDRFGMILASVRHWICGIYDYCLLRVVKLDLYTIVLMEAVFCCGNLSFICFFGLGCEELQSAQFLWYHFVTLFYVINISYIVQVYVVCLYVTFRIAFSNILSHPLAFTLFVSSLPLFIITNSTHYY